MIDVFSPVGKLLEDLTLKRLLGVLILAICILAFERYTSSFQLSRIQRQAEALATLQQIQADGVAQDPALAAIHAHLIGELRETVEVRPLSLRLPSVASRPAPEHVGYLKFFWGALPWLLLSLVAVPSILRREKEAWTSLFSIVFFAAIFGSIGVSLPTYWPWLNVYLYPWGTFFGLVVLIAAAGLWFANKNRSSSTASAVEVERTGD